MVTISGFFFDVGSKMLLDAGHLGAVAGGKGFLQFKYVVILADTDIILNMGD